MLPPEHLIIFELALIIHNRAKIGYTNPWDFKVARMNKRSVIIRLEMREQGRGALPVNSRLRDQGFASDGMYSDGYEYYKDRFQPPPYSDVEWPIVEQTEDYRTESFIPEYLWGLPVRCLSLFMLYQEYKEKTLCDSALYVTPTNDSVLEQHNSRVVVFYNVPNNGCTPPYDTNMPLSCLVNAYIDEWRGRAATTYRTDGRYYETQIREEVHKIRP